MAIKRDQKREFTRVPDQFNNDFVFIAANQLQADHTITVPSGIRFRNLIKDGRVIDFACKRASDTEETRQHMQNVSPYPAFHFLCQTLPRFLVFLKDCPMDTLLNLFANSKNIYLLQVLLKHHYNTILKTCSVCINMLRPDSYRPFAHQYSLLFANAGKNVIN